MIADHITVLKHCGNDYTVCFQQGLQRIQAVHGLTFDEMIGLVIKLTIPFHDNAPIFSPRQLFLDAPNTDITRAEQQERVDNFKEPI